MMLRLWSQVARPQLSCSCIACSSSVTGVLARRTASATTRRRLKLVDAFTILLAPIFATAFVADASWKDRRRIEWDKKIAEVEGEVERLQRQETQILRSWSSGVNARRKETNHTRSYSTDVRSRVLEDETDEDVDAPRWRTMESEVEGDDDAHQGHVGARQEHLTPNPRMTEVALDAGRRIERLVALKLAIRMLLHVKVGPSPRFRDLDPDYTYDSNINSEDLNGLIDKLKVVRRSLYKLNSAKERLDVSPSQKMPRREQSVVDREIRNHVHDFRLGNLTVTRLVKRIGNSIIRSPEPPSVKAYIPLMTTLSRARLDELVYLVMAAIDEGRLALSNHSVFNIIWQYGKNRDANRFDLFLKSVMKMDAATKYTESWEWRRINQVQVPCPTSNDSRLLQILVYTALKCNQPHRAGAWVSQLKYSHGPARHTSHVLRNFMKFYATNRDWQSGQAWLSAALDWSVSPGPNVIRDLQRVVFAMLELCVACGKREAYTCILEAAVQARVGVFTAESDLKFIQRSKSILAEWEKLHSSVPTRTEDESSSAQSKARDFCDAVTPKLESLEFINISPRFEWPTPASADFQFRDGSSELPISIDDSVTKWRELCQKQAAELGKAKAELAELEWLRSRIVKSEIEGRDSQASISPPTLAGTSRRRRDKNASLLTMSVNPAPDSVDGPSIPPSSPKEKLLPSSNMAPTVLSGVCQETNTPRSDVGKPTSELEHNWPAIPSQAADLRPRRRQSSGVENLIRARTSSHFHFELNKESESMSAQKRLRHEIFVESIREDSSPYPGTKIQPDSIRSNGLSEFKPFAVSPSNLGQDTDHFRETDAYNPNPDALDSPANHSCEPPARSAGVELRHPLDDAMDQRLSPDSAPSSKSATEASKDIANLEPPETSKQTRKGQWISFLKMPRERKLSARATLRYIHLGKSELQRPVEPPLERFVDYTDRKRPPYIVLRLGQLPPPKAVKWVDGEFKPRKWDTRKAEAYAARMKARSINNGRA
jgi:hypothetical protein